MTQLDPVAPAHGEWECMECGYIVKGLRLRKPEQCPECGAPAKALEFFPDDEEGWEDDVEDESEEEEEF